MYKIIKYCSTGLIAVLLFYAISFPLNNWFSLTMPRHQIMQLPAMLIIGIVLGMVFSSIHIKDTSFGIGLLIVVMFTLIFWMIPRSIDLTIIYPWFNRVMHINMLVAGFLIPIVLRNIIFEVKIAFLLMISAMLITTGASLRSFTILLCSSFTIEQQGETGWYLLIIGGGLFVATLIVFFRGLAKSGKVLNNH